MNPSPPTYLVDAVVAGLPSEWQEPVRQVLLHSPAWNNWLVIIDHDHMIKGWWAEGKVEARALMKQDRHRAHIFVDVWMRTRRAVESAVEQEMSAIDWDG